MSYLNNNDDNTHTHKSPTKAGSGESSPAPKAVRLEQQESWTAFFNFRNIMPLALTPCI